MTGSTIDPLATSEDGNPDEASKIIGGHRLQAPRWNRIDPMFERTSVKVVTQLEFGQSHHSPSNREHVDGVEESLLRQSDTGANSGLTFEPTKEVRMHVVDLELPKLSLDRLRTIERNSKDSSGDLFDHPVSRQSAPPGDITGIWVCKDWQYKCRVDWITPKLPDALADLDDQSRTHEPSKGPRGRGQRHAPSHCCITSGHNGPPQGLQLRVSIGRPHHVSPSVVVRYSISSNQTATLVRIWSQSPSLYNAATSESKKGATSDKKLS